MRFSEPPTIYVVSCKSEALHQRIEGWWQTCMLHNHMLYILWVSTVILSGEHGLNRAAWAFRFDHYKAIPKGHNSLAGFHICPRR